MNRIITFSHPTFRFFCKIAKSDSTKLERIVPFERTKFKIDSSKLPPKTKIDLDTITLLEKLSLVNCTNKEAIETLETKLEFADQILQVDTVDVEPMITPLEDM